jgi:hypothetical protein
VEEDLEGEVRVSLVEWILARPKLDIAMDPELEQILATIQVLEAGPLPVPVPALPVKADSELDLIGDDPLFGIKAQVVIEGSQVMLRPGFNEGQSACLDQLFEQLRVTGCMVIDAPVYWEGTRVHRLTCLRFGTLSASYYMRRNVFFYTIREQEAHNPITELMDEKGWGEVCVDEISRVHGVMSPPQPG